MPRTNKKTATSSKKKASATATGNSNARFVICPYTDQKVFVAKATLKDLKEPNKSNNKSQKRLWTIASATIRQEHYQLVAQAIAKVEQDLLPSYGGRSWEVSVTLSEPNGRVLFRWFKGRMELAVLPHLLERIPNPPAWPGKRCGQPPDEYQAMQGEVAEAVAKRKQFHSEQGYIANLTTREVSTLSTVAYEVLRGHPHNHPAPQVSTKWRSPDAKTFTSRKAAWEYAEILSKQEVLINRNLLGVGASGKLLQVFTPSPKTALEVGQLRFIRDGLWVVGQELSWQENRPAEWQAQQDEQEAQPKIYKSGLQLYIAMHRQQWKEDHGITLTDADKELRKLWRQLSPQEQQVWNDKVQEQIGESLKEDSESDDGSASDDDDEEVVEYVSPLQFFIEKRRQDYRYERQIELNGDKFTLAQADRELRAQWREMTEKEQDEWIIKLGGEVEGEEDEEDEETTDDKDEEDETADRMDLDSELCKNSEDNAKPAPICTKVARMEENSPVEGDPKTTQAIPDSVSSPSDHNIVDEKTGDDAPDISPPKQVDSASIIETDFVQHGESKSKSPATVSDTSASMRFQRAKPLPSRITNRWCMKPKQISLCHDACMEHFETVMRTVKNRDLARELADGFDVLRERGHGRFDMELPAFDNKEFDFLNEFKKTPWMPVVHAILGEDVVLIHKGCFLSLPGAGAQVYHQDGVHLNNQSQQPCHAINVFIPLVDLQSKNGPTEFVLGSHVLGHDGYDRDFLETPKPVAGTPVIFDYRLGHRGLANSSHSSRPIVYCTYARAADGKEFRDQVNFSRRRYHKIGELAAKPLSREERRNKRKLVVDLKEEEDLQKALELSVQSACTGNSDKGADEKEFEGNNDESAYKKQKVAKANEKSFLSAGSKMRDLCVVPVPTPSSLESSPPQIEGVV
ncbi:phytanoyl-CoA dioxygenase family protein [Nitzschia inconspicua]|uniref:Phytanoyl-CoA dioxygenase family protein n=1 Tax=Nitzschia inconspicua TaxID=303405 RepID=A0A9K3LYT4_9STRA|nr:phytanoyl-CoA dioxygenase family protein [Nitzschia inconspicua]